MTTRTAHDPWEPLRDKGFAAFFVAASISNAASWMQLVAVSSILYDLTRSTTWLGLSTVASLMPAVILTPFAGVLADRVSRRTILLVTQMVQMAAAFTIWWAYRTDSLTPWRIIGVGFVTGITVGFQTAAWQTFVPLLVPDAMLTKAVQLNSMQYTLARALGPAAAGWTVHRWGNGAAIFSNAVTYPLVIAVLVFANPRANSTASSTTSVAKAFADGAKHVWANSKLRFAVCLATVMALCGQSLQYLAAGVSVRILHHPSKDNGTLLVGLGVGAVIGSMIATNAGDHWRRATRLLIAIGLYILMTTVLIVSSNFTLAMFAFGLGGAAHFIMSAMFNTLIQTGVPDELRGRALSFYFVGILGGIPIGAQILGKLADVFTIRIALAIDLTVLLSLFVWLTASGAARKLDAS